MDQYFILVILALWIYAKSFTVAGKVQLDRKGIPTEFKSKLGKEELSTSMKQAK